ncbi:MAG: hypothetical protein ABI324_07360 [Ktedonobacteraceae bacterium]
MSDTTCAIYQDYEEEAADITTRLNRSHDLQEKAELAQSLLDLERHLAPCEEEDDPKCRLQRRAIVPLRRKTAETILAFSAAKHTREE